MSSFSPFASPAARWFGEHFDSLHPLLRELHERQGALAGDAQISVGTGIAGWLGTRMASRMGLPATGACRLRVAITHDAHAMRWSRRFDFAGASPVTIESVFRPVGTWPRGHWEEQTGALNFRLTVDTRDGGWHWQVLRVRWRGVPVPLALLPGARAGKWIEGDAYRFGVSVALPLIGRVLSYGGLLRPVAPETPTGSPRPESGAGGTAS